MSEPEAEEATPRQYTVGEHGFRTLVTDEREWLARPAEWGLNLLPAETRYRKRDLFWHHYFPQLLQNLHCDVCRPVVCGFFTEDGIQLPGTIDGESVHSWQWYRSRHSARDCDGKPFIRTMILWCRRILSAGEVFNRLFDDSHDLIRQRQASELAVPDTGALALELIGPNPFRPVEFSPSWRTDTAVSLARGMYESRDFSPMPILADALQDAGCDSDDILNHCRDAHGVHVRGCWVVDGVLGKA